MQKKYSILHIIGVMIVSALIVIATISFTMHNVSNRLEEDNEPVLVENALDYDSSSVIQILGAGVVQGEELLYLSDSIDETISNYNVAVYQQRGIVDTENKQSQTLAMIDAGFTAVSLANDESLLHAKDGVLNAMNFFDSQDIMTQGINTSTDKQNIHRVFDENGITIIYLSFTDVLNDTLQESEEYLVNVYDPEKSAQIVSEARNNADVVIVSIYWQGENNSLPTDRQKEIAKNLADSGASIIFGNALNAIQPVEWIDDTLVFYSMGNLITDGEEENLGILGAVTITKHTVYNKKQIELTNPKTDFVYIDDDSVKFYDAGAGDSIKEIYNTTIEVLHELDDSIRIGGIQ